VLIEARMGADATGPFVILPLANFNQNRIYSNVDITVRLPAGFSPTTVTWNAPDAAGGTLSCIVNGGYLSVTLPTLDTAAAVVIRGTSSPPGPTATPTATPQCDLPGDLDCDCDVDVEDIMLVASRWRTSEGDDDYDPLYDLDGDGDIDVVDIMLVAVHWGETCYS
jgi:hypothetical protein